MQQRRLAERRGLDWRLKELAERFANPRPAPTVPVPNPTVLRRSIGLLAPLCDWYFRSEVRYLERVPGTQTLIVANHDGGLLPFDAVCFAVAWHRRFQFERPLRILMHEIPFHIAPRITRWLHDVGIVSAAPQNLEALLDRGESVLVFPGAAREAYRTFARRREIDLGRRTGFVARALRRGIPITPVASAGGHETAFILCRGGSIARLLGLYEHLHADAWPLVAGLPWGLWLGPMIPYLPLPSKITAEVLPPIDLRAELSSVFRREIGASDAERPQMVQTGFELVRGAIHAGVNRLYDARRFPVLG